MILGTGQLANLLKDINKTACKFTKKQMSITGKWDGCHFKNVKNNLVFHAKAKLAKFNPNVVVILQLNIKHIIRLRPSTEMRVPGPTKNGTPILINWCLIQKID